MKTTTFFIVLALLVAISHQDENCENCENSIYDDPRLIPTRKGLTYRATEWPSRSNHWTGKMACEGCDPKDGDTPCTVSLPILCILHYKTLDRPFYFYQPDLTSYHNEDGAFFNPWTGGVLVVTDPVRGLDITSYEKGDQYCKDYYGMDAKFAEFHDGFYLPDMNGFNSGVVRAWSNWQYSLEYCGAWSLWGYFNHHWRGKTWLWIKDQPNGNCGDI